MKTWLEKLIAWHRTRAAKRERDKWDISIEEAKKNAAAVLHEFGAVAAGEYMDEWMWRNWHD